MNDTNTPAPAVTPPAKRTNATKGETDLTKAFRIWAEHPTSSFKLQRLVAHMVDHELAARLTGSTRAD